MVANKLGKERLIGIILKCEKGYCLTKIKKRLNLEIIRF